MALRPMTFAWRILYRKVDDGITQVIVQQPEEALQQLAQWLRAASRANPVRRWESACRVQRRIWRWYRWPANMRRNWRSRRWIVR